MKQFPSRAGLAGNAAGTASCGYRYPCQRYQNHTDGTEAARMCGIECYMLNLTPEPNVTLMIWMPFADRYSADRTAGIKNGGGGYL